MIGEILFVEKQNALLRQVVEALCHSCGIQCSNGPLNNFVGPFQGHLDKPFRKLSSKISIIPPSTRSSHWHFCLAPNALYLWPIIATDRTGQRKKEED
jgi:hypothetical protein